MVPKISLIAAIARNRVVGYNNQLPWHLPADLQHFKQLTLGKPIVMGRKTWESLPGLLPGRRHLVITHDQDYQAPGTHVVHSLEAALDIASDSPEIMIVGGAALYAAMLPKAECLYLTLVEADVRGDAYFPEIDWEQWQETAREFRAADEKNPYDCTFLTLARISSAHP
jgi:dihydrofolate reductase